MLATRRHMKHACVLTRRRDTYALRPSSDIAHHHIIHVSFFNILTHHLIYFFEIYSNNNSRRRSRRYPRHRFDRYLRLFGTTTSLPRDRPIPATSIVPKWHGARSSRYGINVRSSVWFRERNHNYTRSDSIGGRSAQRDGFRSYKFDFCEFVSWSTALWRTVCCPTVVSNRREASMSTDIHSALLFRFR